MFALLHHAKLQDLGLAEVLDAEVVLSAVDESLHRYKADDLSTNDLETVATSLHTYHLVSTIDGCLGVVSEVHRDLYDVPVGQLYAHSLAEA